jgi:Flp pilus assembly protein TadG
MTILNQGKKMKRTMLKRRRWIFRQENRKGVFFVLAVICLLGAMTFVGMSVDLGMITVTKTRMQATADAAALAAAQEIVVAVRDASWDSESGLDMTAVQNAAAADARAMAEYVADINGFYIDPDADVVLGRRLLNSDGVTYTETWGTGPYNCVKVDIRKNNSDSSAPDAKLPLIFAPVVGERAQSLSTSATAFIESRDIVCTLDFSSSMNDDSCMSSATISRLTKAGVESNLDAIWDALVASDVRFSNDADTKKFPSAGFGTMNSYAGTYNSSSSQTAIEALGLYTPEQNYFDDWSLNTSGSDYYFTAADGYQYRRYTQGEYAGQLRKAPSN